MDQATAENVASNVAEDVKPEVKAENAVKQEAPKPSAAQDLRNIQALLAGGIFPGNYAPQIVAAYQLLEKMASQVEMEASKNVTSQETK